MGNRKRSKKPAQPSMTAVQKQKAEEKKQRRLERQAEEAARKARAASMRKIRNGIAGALGVVLVGVLGFLVLKPDPELQGVQRFASDGRTHLVDGETWEYATATPTSGPHSASSLQCGFYPTEVPLENAVHALEHGVVVLWVQPDITESMATDLRNLIDQYDAHVMISPNSGIDTPIVAAAWQRLKAYDEVNDDLKDFVDIYRRRGPEKVACPIEF